MRVEKRESGDERRILIGMIVDRMVLGEIAMRWNGRLFRSKWSNLIGDWCVEFYRKHRKAPGPIIESLYERWAERTPDKEAAPLIERFLASLSEQYAQLRRDSNSSYVMDLAGRYFNRVRLERLQQDLQKHLEAGDLEQAEKSLDAGRRTIDIGVGAGIDVLHNQEAIKRALDMAKEPPLVTYPGPLGEFFAELGLMSRENFIAFLAPEKRGKTFWLLDLAWRAMEQRRKVAFFEVGDMSEPQIMQRFLVRAAKRPLHPRVVKYPRAITREPGESMAEVVLEERPFEKGLDWQTAWNACQKIMKTKIKSKRSFLKLSCHPNSSVGVSNLESILAVWEREDWTPDVICIDYADLLLPPPNLEGRDAINETWKRLRGLSQSLHCLVATATQANAAAYRTDTISMANFSEDKRKNAHVTAMIGLNATAEEKERGITRINLAALREGEYSEQRCVHVAGCLSLANPAICSTF